VAPFELIIFDLDGTLIDSSEDLAISTNATRANFGLPPLEQSVINSYVGNGAAVLVRRAMGAEASEERVAEALQFFLHYYREHSLENTRPYDGIREVVDQLANQGRLLGVLTNKPERISVDILQALGMADRFFRIYGGNTFPEKKPQPTGILRMCEEAQRELTRTLMVGDSRVDIETARNAGVGSCGVTWGFQPETLAEQQPDFTIDRPDALLKIVSA